MRSNPNQGSAVLIMAAILLSGMLALPVDVSRAVSTRGVGEDIMIEAVFQLIDPLTSVVEASFDIYSIIFDDVPLDADEIRAAYSNDPEGVADSITSEMGSRINERLETAIDGADFQLTGWWIDPNTLDNDTAGQGTPVSGTVDFRGDIPPEELIPAGYLSDIGPGRMPFVMGALFKSGFTYSRSYTFSAGPGESIKYILPSSFDLLGDGAVVLLNEQPGQPIPQDGYLLSLSGGAGTQVERYSFKVRADRTIVPMEESIDGIVTLDMPLLDSISVRSSVNIHSVRASKTSMLDDIPQGMDHPAYLGAGTIRYLALEGLLDEKDLKSAVDELAADAAEDLSGAMDADIYLETRLDMGISGEDPPLSGSDLVSSLMSNRSIILHMDTDSYARSNITKGYDPQDVMGLLNGGLIISPEFDRAVDDRYEVRIVLPEGLMIRGRDHLENVGGRRTYALPYGAASIISQRAPQLNESHVSLSGSMDMSVIRSVYLVDATVQLQADLELLIGHVGIDISDIDIDLDMGIELEHLSADLARLMVRMGILSRFSFEDRIRDDLHTFLSDMVPNKEDLGVEFVGDTLDFDGDLENVDGQHPLRLNISVRSNTELIDPALGREGNAIRSGFLPYHLDPLVPMRSYKRSIPLEEASEWDLYISISFPSGVGVRGNLGKGSDHYQKELETHVEDGIPTMMLISHPGEGDHIYLELSGAGYFAYNNVSVCFFSVIFLLAFILLFVLVKVGKAVSKKIKDRRTVQPKVDDDEWDPNKVLEGPDGIEKVGPNSGPPLKDHDLTS
ncbi:MAG: hypothetical protein QCI82_08205 [Candidatus Thermoplasmatota archaeon]|nr:hypothetical protein [Candidatus Thermoplasmatota archaeon]